jgi:transcriptional regulator with XRE-family HTH domain
MLTSTPHLVGAPLREARVKVGLSRERLARLADCSTTAIAQFERGLQPDASPTLDRVWRVLDALVGGDAQS